MEIRHLEGEMEVLEHRRGRIAELLALGWVSAEMHSQLTHTLKDLDHRLGQLRTEQGAWDRRLAA